MVSPVENVMSQLATDWAALTPPDRTSISYYDADAHIDDLDVDELTADRAFMFRTPQLVEFMGTNGASTMVRWTVQAVLVLTDEGRSGTQERNAAANEQVLFVRAVELRDTWAAGVWAVELDDPSVDVERDDDTGALIITINLSVQTEESDS